MRVFWMTGAVCALSVGALYCQKPPGTPQEKPPASGEAEGNNAFALKLYGELSEQEGNLAFSPLSVRTALAMTYAGARGRTAAQMEEVLCFSRKGERLHRALGAFVRGLAKRQGQSRLSIASSLWGQKGYSFRPEFLELSSRSYEAGFGELDFTGATEKARKTINAWVEERTSRRIRELLQAGDLRRDTVLVLVNAIHFKGSWMSEFDPKNTRKRAFLVAAGGDENARRIQVPMMYQRGDFGFSREKDLKVLELPYAGGALSMLILLPREPGGLSAMEASLTARRLRQLVGKLGKRKIGVFLPRFRCSARFSLEKVLVALGMSDAFGGPAADFSGMTGKRDLWIDEVIHQADVEVNEEGTEAAAATAVMMKRGGEVFHARHPFLFVIRDRSSGAILFLGRVTDPSKAERS